MNTMSLNGFWQCTLPGGKNVSVSVPGCVEQVWDDWSHAGPYILQREFNYRGNGSVRLSFGGVSYYSEIFLNGYFLGNHEGIWDPFVLDCGSALKQGSNLLKVVIIKPGYSPQDQYPLRTVLSGFMPDVLTTFAGIWDDVQLFESEDLFVLSSFGEGDYRGRGEITAQIEVLHEGKLDVDVWIEGPGLIRPIYISEQHYPTLGEQDIKIDFHLPEVQLWEPGSPVLYTYRLVFTMGRTPHESEGRFGFREIKAVGRQLLLNGKPLYFRGILHWGYDDEAIIPTTDKVAVKNELLLMKAHGFNAVKHCLYIPRKPYLDMMDELGMLAWVELPLWLPEQSAQLHLRIRREYPRILRTLRGHPSLSLISLGCELDRSIPASLLHEMYLLAKRESGVPVRDNSGSGECYGGLAVDYADFYDYHFYAELPHLEELIEHFSPAWRDERPWIFGEFADSDTMRDLSVVRATKKQSVLKWEEHNAQRNPISQLKPDFLLNKHDERMEDSGIRDEFEHIEELSFDHSLTHRKVTLELTRSFPEICAYNVTSIRDVPIATSGLLDDMCQPKFTPEAFRRFNHDAVLIQAWDLSRSWIGADRIKPAERYNFTGGDQYSVRILLSNYTDKDLSGSRFSYQLSLGGRAVEKGEQLVNTPLPCGTVNEIAHLSFELPEVFTPETLILAVLLEDENGQIAYNDFPIFIYPRVSLTKNIAVYDPTCTLKGFTYDAKNAVAIAEKDLPNLRNGTVLISSVMADKVEHFVRSGGKLILLSPDGGAFPTVRGPMWREGMIRPFPHPVLTGIKKECPYDDLRYYSMTTDVSIDSKALTNWRASDIRPILRRYDCRQWTASDYLCSFRLGSGLCVASTLRFGNGLGKAPRDASQNAYAGYLIESIVRYLLIN